jgi:hypothetical protein
MTPAVTKNNQKKIKFLDGKQKKDTILQQYSEKRLEGRICF